MKRLFTIAALVMTFFSTVSASAGLEMTEVENPTYRCEQKGGGFAIALTKTGARIWAVDPGQTEGIELQNVETSTYDCRHCFDFSAGVEWSGVTVSYDLKLRSEAMTNLTLTATLSNKGRSRTSKIPCELIKAKK